MASSMRRLYVNRSSSYCNINRSIYNINRRFKSTINSDINKTETLTTPSNTPNFVKRFKTTAEVTLSKIFPAGFYIIIKQLIIQ
jgi:hypothetical protein